MRERTASSPDRRTRARDWGRHALLLLLLVSALLLLRRTGYLSDLRGRLSLPGGPAASGAAAETPLPRPFSALTPVAVTVRGAEGGGRYGAAYDAEETAAVFRRFSVDLGEALGSAGAPRDTDEAALHALLDRSALTLHFACPMPLELLSGWLGVEMSSDAAADAPLWLCLSASETEALLGYRTQSGACRVCATAVNPESFRAHTAEYAPNGTLYAWESERLPDGGDALLLPGAPEAAALVSAVPLPRAAETDAIMAAMGMNSFVASSYTEADGTMVYVSDDNTLRLSPDGTVFFRRTVSPDTAADDEGLAAAVSRAWQAAERSLLPMAGDGEMRFAGALRVQAQRTVTIYLDYAADGIPVRLASGHAAEIVLRGETVVQARLQLRQFTRTDRAAQLLPYLQAAAIAAHAQGRAELIYADAGEATACMWVIADG